MNIIFLDVDGVLNGAKDFGYERSPDTIDCYVDTEKGKQHFGRVNREQLNKLREIVKLADAKVYLISSWSVAFKIEEFLNVQETFNEFFGFEVHATQCGMQTANGRAKFAIDLLNPQTSQITATRYIWMICKISTRKFCKNYNLYASFQ